MRHTTVPSATRRYLLAFSAAAAAAWAIGGCSKPPPPNDSTSDVEVTTQHGRTLRFQSDLLSGATWLVSFLFTSCTSRCPLTARNLAVLRARMTPSDDFRLISITIDPVNDTPARLLEWSAPFKNPDWILLTADEDCIARLTTSLLGQAAAPGKHMPLALIGSGPRFEHAIRASTSDAPELLLSLLRRARQGETSLTLQTP
jgi:cytochrome oxidase Cu insertion factor (SCO1/SenC/PrrC family)